jgi:ABC-type lipoprotein release transport system permease subunit
LETIQVCLIGAVAGIGAAFVASRGVEAWVRARLPFSPAGTLIHWDWWLAAGCVAGAVMLGSLAGFLPAWRAAGVPPMTAIRAAGGRA